MTGRDDYIAKLQAEEWRLRQENQALTLIRDQAEAVFNEWQAGTFRYCGLRVQEVVEGLVIALDKHKNGRLECKATSNGSGRNPRRGASARTADRQA